MGRGGTPSPGGQCSPIRRRCEGRQLGSWVGLQRYPPDQTALPSTPLGKAAQFTCTPYARRKPQIFNLVRTKAKACSTEVGKNASPNSAEKNVSIALAECSPAAEPRAHPVVPSSDKPHAKGKPEKEKQNLQKVKKNQPKPLFAGAQQNREGPVRPGWEKQTPLHPRQRRGTSPHPGLWSRGPSDPSRAGRYLHPTAQQSKHFPLKSAQLQSRASAYAVSTSQARNGGAALQWGDRTSGCPKQPLSWHATYHITWSSVRHLCPWQGGWNYMILRSLPTLSIL